MTETVDQTVRGIILTDAAVVKAKQLMEADGTPGLVLRVCVQPGGCSGMRYQLYFDDESSAQDIVKDYDGLKVVTDPASAPYLDGASIDYQDTIQKQGFSIDNPNAKCKCACGDSFC